MKDLKTISEKKLLSLALSELQVRCDRLEEKLLENKLVTLNDIRAYGYVLVQSSEIIERIHQIELLE